MNSYERMQQRKCWMFVWVIGRSLTHCAQCGDPYWVHTHQLGSDGRKRVLISDEQREWVRERYDEFTAPQKTYKDPHKPKDK